MTQLIGWREVQELNNSSNDSDNDDANDGEVWVVERAPLEVSLAELFKQRLLPVAPATSATAQKDAASEDSSASASSLDASETDHTGALHERGALLGNVAAAPAALRSRLATLELDWRRDLVRVEGGWLAAAGKRRATRLCIDRRFGVQHKDGPRFSMREQLLVEFNPDGSTRCRHLDMFGRFLEYTPGTDGGDLAATLPADVLDNFDEEGTAHLLHADADAQATSVAQPLHCPLLVPLPPEVEPLALIYADPDTSHAGRADRNESRTAVDRVQSALTTLFNKPAYCGFTDEFAADLNTFYDVPLVRSYHLARELLSRSDAQVYHPGATPKPVPEKVLRGRTVVVYGPAVG